MTHQSGISVSKELDQSFGDARTQGKSRWVKAQIVNESVVPVKTHPLGSNISSDFATLKSELLPKTPCYILFRLDSQSNNAYQWLLLAYVPDGSTVRERMLYASTRDTLKRQLGLSYFAEDIHGSTPEEFTYEAYLDNQKKKILSDVPMTSSELQTRSERTAEVDLGHTREYVHSVKFPMSAAALDILKALPYGSVGLVQLKVDPTKETIELADSKKSVEIDDLPSLIPNSEPRFFLYTFSHTHESQKFDSLVFIYSCPEKSPVKLKMLYSTVKAVAIGTSESLGLTISKKVEITEANEITEDLLIELLHPPSEDKKQTFNKPSRPGKGKPRVVRSAGKS